MIRHDRKYILDTHVFIQAFRRRSANEALQQFHRVFAPFEYLSAVVAQELRAAIRTAAERRSLERNVLDVYRRADRVVTPSVRAWHKSGDVVAAMAGNGALELGKVSKALSNDILIALSCLETGSVLVTDNQRDFVRIRKFVTFEFAPAWSTIG